MNDALELIYYTLSKFYDFVFGSYIFEGVSLGMIWVVSFIFTVLLYNLLAVPKIRVGGRSSYKKDSSDRGDNYENKN